MFKMILKYYLKCIERAITDIIQFDQKKPYLKSSFSVHLHIHLILFSRQHNQGPSNGDEGHSTGSQ